MKDDKALLSELYSDLKYKYLDLKSSYASLKDKHAMKCIEYNNKCEENGRLIRQIAALNEQLEKNIDNSYIPANDKIEGVAYVTKKKYLKAYNDMLGMAERVRLANREVERMKTELKTLQQ